VATKNYTTQYTQTTKAILILSPVSTLRKRGLADSPHAQGSENRPVGSVGFAAGGIKAGYTATS